MTDTVPVIALTTGFGAFFVWCLVLLRTIIAWSRGCERRTSWVLVPVTSVIVSAGMLASSLAFGISSGVVVIEIDAGVLSLIASMGRGAMLAAGAIVLAEYHPNRRPPRLPNEGNE